MKKIYFNNTQQPIRRYELSERKKEFARLYFDFDRQYFGSRAGNAYRCAIQVRYSDSYAKKILSYMGWRELERLMKISEKVDLC